MQERTHTIEEATEIFIKEYSEDNAYYGDYLIMQKIGERICFPGHIVPVVRIKITENKQLPQTNGKRKYCPCSRSMTVSAESRPRLPQN